MKLPDPHRLAIPSLGEPLSASPLRQRERCVDETDRVLGCASTAELEHFTGAGLEPPSFEPAGPRERVFFAPDKTTCGIVTCGGLCPGLNDVIRSIVLAAYHGYGVSRVIGFRYGYSGLSANPHERPIELHPDVVADFQAQGGTHLGSSRGPQSIDEMIDTLRAEGVDILFVIGGDGTMKGASAISAEIERRGLDISIIGIPKTIDNDLRWVQRSFGFATAVEAARAVITAAHAEALSVWHGVGLVKLMGRYSGFIAAHAALASGQVNYCLIPEARFELAGEDGLLRDLERRLDERHHAVIVVAEGAGQHLIDNPNGSRRDASGNLALEDIGLFLRQAIHDHFASIDKPVDLKYIDPSYVIRSQPANTMDASFGLILGQHALHAGMSGRTAMMVGLWNGRFTHVPLDLVAEGRRQVDLDSEVWQRVLETTGQPLRSERP